MQSRIYLDYNATTPCDPEVVKVMLPYFHEKFGNAASKSHVFGWEADEVVEIAREKIAKLIGAQPSEIVFTSGSTEAINLAMKGAVDLYKGKGSHVVTMESEHKAVLDTCAFLEKNGAEITYLKPKSDGLIDPSDFKAALREDTILASVMWANNETGVIQPIEELTAICRENGILFFTDATQAVGKIPLDVNTSGVHLLSLSAHKFYGPKGVGALYVRNSNPRVKLRAQIHGGQHERGFRSGTLNVPGLVGMGKAAEIAELSMQADHDRLLTLRDKMQEDFKQLKEVRIHGNLQKRLPHVLNLSFRFVKASTLLSRIGNEIALATGSACTSASLDPSHVLISMGIPDDLAHASIRISLGRFTTEDETIRVVEVLKSRVEEIRNENPMWQMFKQGIPID